MILRLTLLLAVIFFTPSLRAQDTQTQITEEAISVLRQSLDEMDVSSCYKLDRSALEMKFKESLNEFFKEEGAMEYIKEEIEYQGEDAIVNLAAEASDFAHYHLMEKLGLDEEAFYECQEKVVEQTYAQGEYGEDYEEEVADFMKYMGGALSKSDVGLPVYENSELVSYMNKDQSEQMLKQLYPDINGPFLNSAVYFTTDDFEAVRKFYEEELSDFNQGEIGSNSMGFASDDYDFNSFLSLEGIKKWSVMESVWVEKLESSSEGKIKIEIHWE
ncbi:hypothetical protein [Reichenbachiella sp.]|uniref:hypothetical protein n=1 Tax=Reichenbachiella sp. TaxID=2184521 RepID=UPI003BB1E0B8